MFPLRFLVLANLHSCFYNSMPMETGKMFSIVFNINADMVLGVRNQHSLNMLLTFFTNKEDVING